MRVIVYGALGGRFDHLAQNFNVLFAEPAGSAAGAPRAWARRFAQLTLLADDCVASLLPAGRSRVRVACAYEGPTCGLVPLGAPVRSLTTRGLHWDVEAWRSEFGGSISSSNRVERWRAAGEGAGVGTGAGAEAEVEVVVEASDPVIWTLSVAPAGPSESPSRASE
jgi:hypothetical protein